jgi:hypothetical protein
MKRTHIPAVLLTLLGLVGCSKPDSANLSTNTNGNATSQAVQKASNTGSADFSKTFEGAINNEYQIQMSLQRSGQELSGSYFYTKHKTDIQIKGTIDGQDNFTINEFDGKGNQTGVFKGRLISGSEMEGTWSKPNGDKSMPFALKAIGSNGEPTSTADVTSTANSNNSPADSPSSSQTLDQVALAKAKEAFSQMFIKCGDTYNVECHGLTSCPGAINIDQYTNPTFSLTKVDKITEADKLNGVEFSGIVQIGMGATRRLKCKQDWSSWYDRNEASWPYLGEVIVVKRRSGWETNLRLGGDHARLSSCSKVSD